MSIPSIIILSYLAVVGIGGVLNGLAIWLIIYHSPKEMRIYRKILLQICVSDVLTLIFAFLTQSVIYSNSVFTVHVLLGPIQSFPNPWQNLAYIFEVWLYCVSIYTLAAEFVYRYLVLNRNKLISFKQYLCMLAIGPCLTSLILELADEVDSYPNKNCEHLFAIPEAFKMLELPAETLLAVCERHTNSDWGNFMKTMFLLNILLVYLIILLLGHRMWSYLHRHLKTTAKNGIRTIKSVTELDRQITMNLISKAVIPVLSLAFITAPVFIPESSPKAGPWIFWSVQICRMFAVYSLPIFDPIVTILTVQSYREKFFRLAQRLWSKKTISVSPSNHGHIFAI